MIRAVFLDRDGTINVDTQYVSKTEEFVFIPGAIDAIKRLQQAGFAVVIITNQSGVGRGLYTEADYATVMDHMRAELAKRDIQVDGVYECFHHTAGRPPYNIRCTCRKPAPGMVLRAAKDMDIDLAQSFIMGDKWCDIGAGLNAGIPATHCLLLRTGKAGFDEKNKVEGTPVFDDIAAATAHILREA